jgi:hypothetical protein
MPHIYEHIFETFRVVDPDDNSIVDQFADQAQWLDSPGCLFQRNNLVLSSRIRTAGTIKAGLFISVVLKGSGGARSHQGADQVRYSDDSIAVMALREPTHWDGDAPRGAHMQAAGIAFPVSSLKRLGLLDEAWQYGQLAEMTAQYRDRSLPAKLTSVQSAVDVATKAVPEMTPSFVAFP